MNYQQWFHEVGSAEVIETTCIAPPLPVRCFDWQATRKGLRRRRPVGFGATEQEAIENLIQQEKQQ